jgi:hypothetical protein
MTRRLGFLAAVGLAMIGVAYAIVVAVGVARAGFSEPITDPVLAVMEIITLAAAPLVVILMAAVHQHADEERKLLSLIALCFAVLMAGMTSAVHFVALTAGRQTGFRVLEWPSTLYAVELLAWDVFLGLSLMFAGPVFRGAGLHAMTRRALMAAGALCLAGTVGPVLGRMPLQRVGILGYGVALPIASSMLALVFRGAGAEAGIPQDSAASLRPTDRERARDFR